MKRSYQITGRRMPVQPRSNEYFLYPEQVNDEHQLLLAIGILSYKRCTFKQQR